MDFLWSIVLVTIFMYIVRKCCGRKQRSHQMPVPQCKHRGRNRLLESYGVRHPNAIVDQFHSFDEVSTAIRRAGLESSNLIFGIDFTVSNVYQGARSYHGRSLHSLSPGMENPYQQVIRAIGETLEPFDDDGLIPVFGFGDSTTKDKAVFSFRQEVYCRGVADVLNMYNQITPVIQLSGPTSFAPLIHRAIDIVQNTQQYHILVIIADGQVTLPRVTAEAIIAASRYPLSIVVVGVGDGPWHEMMRFDDALPQRSFDNFQFVEFERVCAYGARANVAFALHALMEIPDQYADIRRLGLLEFGSGDHEKYE